jgi:hypothetical protein
VKSNVGNGSEVDTWLTSAIVEERMCPGQVRSLSLTSPSHASNYAAERARAELTGIAASSAAA